MNVKTALRTVISSSTADVDEVLNLTDEPVVDMTKPVVNASERVMKS